jgi:hypothetical protein
MWKMAGDGAAMSCSYAREHCGEARAAGCPKTLLCSATRREYRRGVDYIAGIAGVTVTRMTLRALE